MKLGLLTPHCARNYGGLLQAYALQTVLQRLGHDARIVDYVPDSRRSHSVFPSLSCAPKPCAINLLTLLRYPQLKRRHKHFADFSNRFFRLTRRRYTLCDDIAETLPCFDAYVCGSDQLWRPRMHSLDTIRAYCLGFVTQDNVDKIAYAASFGVSSLPQSFQRYIRPFIHGLTHISVRETTGQTLVREISGRDSQVVLDPTLLLPAEHWRSIATTPCLAPPYILVYCQRQSRRFFDLVRHVKNVTSLPVVVVALLPFNLIPGADHVIYDTSFPEYIGLFANAACVCTNSLHGTAFSLIFRRPFWTVPHELANSRLADLLRRIALSERQIDDPRFLPASPLELDYTKPAALLAQAQTESLQFLTYALGQ